MTETVIDDGVAYEKANKKVRAAYAKQATAILGTIFARKAVEQDIFSKLSRYETTLERSLFRTLHELQRLQAQRDGQSGPPPLTLDVDVSGGSS